ncbi:uroporphyrinogen decarboxylase [Streptomyces tanashiensis]
MSAPASSSASWARPAPDVVGVDWRVPLDEAARRVGPGKALQGNLDPAVLFASREVVEAKTDEVLAAAKDLEGHIFNLGHGVMPAMDPDALSRLVEYVHTRTAV